MVLRRLLLLLLLFSCLPTAAAEPKGLWLLPRKDAQNTARADLPASMSVAPQEVWRFGGDPNRFSAIFLVTLNNTPAYLVQAYSTLQLMHADGSVVWRQPKLGVSSILAADKFNPATPPSALVLLGTADIALLNLETGQVRWKWTAPPGTNLSSTALWKIYRHGSQVHLIIFPQNSIRGVCIDLAAPGDKPPLIWDREYPNTYWQGFGPQIVLADMDKDGIPDVVLASKPGYAAVIDALTGAIKFDVHYQVTNGHDEGRPYGLLQATDLDGDGFPDVVMVSCQVEEYISIIHNEAGRALRPVWSIFLEHDLPEDKLELRPQVTSIADLDGDGKKELVLGLFNTTGDQKWHTVVIDPMKGFTARRADLVDRYFWGCYDLTGTGVPTIITSTEPIRKTAATSTLQAVDGRTFKDIATVPDAALATTGSAPLTDDRGFMAIRNTPLFYKTSNHIAGLLLSHHASKSSELWSLRDGQSLFTTYPLSPHASLLALSTGTTHPSPLDLSLSTTKPSLTVHDALIASNKGQRQLILSQSDNTVLIGQPDLTRPGEFKSSHILPGAMPAAWESPAGDLTLVTALDNSTVQLTHPFDDSKPIQIHLPHPLYRNSTTRSGPTLLPFGADTMYLYAGLQTGVHTLASALYDSTGKTLWLDEKEGPYPRIAGILPGSPDRIVIDNHGKHLIYSLTDKSTLIAHGWNNTIPGRGDGGKYVVPIIGPFGPAGETRILMSSGLQSLETLDATGKRLAKHDFASTYEFEWNSSSVARLRGPAAPWDLLMVNRDGILHCFDVATCTPRWTYDLHCKATLPINIITADVDGNGNDDLLIGLPNGTLLALKEQAGTPTPIWQINLDTGIRDTIAADIDGDGKAEIIVETEDGSVRIYKGK